MDKIKQAYDWVAGLMYPNEWSMIGAALLLFVVIFFIMPLFLEVTWLAYELLISI